MTKSKDSDHCRTKPFNFVHTLVIDFTTVECDTLYCLFVEISLHNLYKLYYNTALISN